MKITKHISFYYLEDRFKYINRIIDETNKYSIQTDIFIHTNNKNVSKDLFNKYTNGSINIIWHDLSNINPFYLTWKCRDLLYKQKDDYDIFMYIEDDILVSDRTIQYWLKYNEDLIKMNYNLGFVRIEVDDKQDEYITDIFGYNGKIDKMIKINEIDYAINDKNPYCAFWIYNKKEFNRFVNSKYYNINNIPGYDIRERSAIGLHGAPPHGNAKYWYDSTLIPIVNNKLIEDCKIYHMPNNYVGDQDPNCATIKFNECIKENILQEVKV